MLKDPNHELKEKEGRYYDVCTPNGGICPSTWEDNSNCVENEEMDKEEENPEESDWSTDLGGGTGLSCRVSAPMRRPRQPLKVLMFQLHKCPAGWPAGI